MSYSKPRCLTRSRLHTSFILLIHFGLISGISLSGQAGDILRGGMTGNIPPPNSHSSGSGSNLPNGAQPNDSLARTAQALQAVQAMQAAARSHAQSGPANLGLDPNHPGTQLPNVPNGLTVGGLEVAPGVPTNLIHPAPGTDPSLWKGATLPVETTKNGATDVTITQTAQQALLHWQTFNVGKQTTVTFDQSAGGGDVGQWIAFNTITDPSGIPSQILGSINALGQVYLLNQNGIIFGGSSQINLHALVASSLPINTNLVARGLLNNPDDQFLFSTLPIPILPNGGTMPAFNPPPPPNTPDGHQGDITVEAGALLTSPTTPDHVGGRIALLGPNVTNNGTISTPDGQTAIAAGEQVAFEPHATSDPSLRGLDVYVGSVDSLSGAATNSGLIETPRADLSMVGETVNQLGFVDSSTSVALNGRVDLLADYNTVVSVVLGAPNFNPSASGVVTLGPQSVAQILPELSSDETVVGTQLALRSQVNIRGEAIHLGGDSLLVAPNAIATLDAGTWLAYPAGFVFTSSEGQIYLNPGASIDVSGSRDVPASVTDNIISVQLLSPELANSPLQRDGPLRGKTIEVDIRQHGPWNPSLNNGAGGYTWVGTPLADTSGYVSLIQRSVGELTISGGTVDLTAGESVVMRPGSKIDVSGGWIDYAGRTIATTQLISEGHIIDVSQATPDIIYQGIYGTYTVVHPKWGVVETMTNPLVSSAHYEPSYVQGGDGGSVSLSAPAVALDGQLVGNTIVGPPQQASVPFSSSLSLTFQAQQATAPLFEDFSPTPPNITFAATSNLAPADPFALDTNGKPLPLRADRVAAVILSPDLVGQDGFGQLAINDSDGNITLPADVALNTQPAGLVTLEAANLDVEGTISSPGGSITLAAYDLSPYELAILKITPGSQTPPPDPTRGNFTLGATASLNTSGLIIDQRLTTSSSSNSELVTNGGAIGIESYNTDLKSGSTINVSGGVLVSARAQPTFGDAGSIVIKGGQDPNLSSIIGGNLTLDARLIGYAGTQTGGSLSILAPLVQIGGSGGANNDTLLLHPAFFNAGGFSSFSLTGFGEATSEPYRYLPGVSITPDTVIAPAVRSWVWDSASPSVVLTPTLLPEALRPPVSLTFSAPGVRDAFSGDLISRGDVTANAGSSIAAGPDGSVTFTGDTVALLGAITAPGGMITVTGASNSSLLFPDQSSALPTVDLGPQSNLSVAGQILLTPNAIGYRTGFVLPGGAISVAGNIVAETGALLNVSGTTGTLDLAPQFSAIDPSEDPGAAPLMPTEVDSNAGSITFSGGQELFLDATLIGRRGGPSALGGSLSISSGRFYPAGTSNPPTPLDITLEVTPTWPTIPVPFYPAGSTAIGNVVLNADGTVADGLGHFTASTLQSHTFDSVTLKGTVDFEGPITLTANRQLTIGTAGVIFADDVVDLNAPYVAIGGAFQPPVSPLTVVPPFTVAGQPFYVPPTLGTGSLNVNGSLIDIGNLSLQNISVANFNAVDGDIRGDGTLDAVGSISLTAGQIYPPTEVTFTIAAYNYAIDGITYSGSVTIQSAGDRPLPLSAGAQLNIYASVIDQSGVLRAPIGRINLGDGVIGTVPIDPISNQPFPITQKLTLAPGSVTSVSAVDPTTGQSLVIPYGTNLNGTSWIDPAGVNITAGGVPTKVINIAAADVDDENASTFDVRGGGDLYAFRFDPGIGGTNDILASSSSFAIIPDYKFDYAPFDPIYNNSSLAVGDQVYLNAGSGLPAGTYTLLPARYALLPGAFLVTPESGAPPTSVLQPDGSSVVAGYRFNNLGPAQSAQPLSSIFEIAPQSVVQSRATYDNYDANTFLAQSARTRDLPIPRLPIDSGELVLAATETMTIEGGVMSQAPTGAMGGLVDISSPTDILIASSGGGPSLLRLDPRELSNFGADSLLIGGFRDPNSDGDLVTVTTPDITVDNAGSPLTGPDVILVANQGLILAPGAEIEQKGTLAGPAETLLFGNGNVAASGDGVLLRVTSDPSAQIVRSGVSDSAIPTLIISGNARITGRSVTLDSTSASSLDSSAVLLGTSVSLDSGQISLVLSDPGQINLGTGLVLSGTALENLESSAQFLSLLSYSSFDTYGIGEVGALDSSGQPAAASFALHTAEIRGFNNYGGIVSFVAKNIYLDNSSGGKSVGATNAPSGTLQFIGDTIHLGNNQIAVDQFSTLTLAASDSILLEGSGGITGGGSVNLYTPLITGASGANANISAANDLVASNPAGRAVIAPANGLGAALTLLGQNVSVANEIVLPSGSVTLHATTGNTLVNGTINVSGASQTFFDLTNYTNGGQVALISDSGYVFVPSSGIINVSAQPGGGSAGELSVSAPTKSFFPGGTLLGQAGANGQAGSFSLDTGVLSDLAGLDSYLDAGSFTASRSIRVRTGDVVVDGTTKTDYLNLSADAGSIAVTGTVDASGLVGGTIDLEASGDVTLTDGSLLSVAGQELDAAGKGGAVSLETTSGVITLAQGSKIDLAIDSKPGGTLDLRAPQTNNANDLAIAPIDGSIVNSSSVVAEGFYRQDADTPGTASIDDFEAAALANANAFEANAVAIESRLIGSNPKLAAVFHVRPGEEIDNSQGSLVLNSDWDLSTWRFGTRKPVVDNDGNFLYDSYGNQIFAGVEPGILTIRASGSITFNGSLADGFGDSGGDIDIPYDDNGYPAPWEEGLLPRFADRTTQQSWSFRITAGADFSAADFRRVQPLGQLAPGAGSLLIGVNGGANIANPPGPNAESDTALEGHYQVIRTGTGDIDISAGRDIALLNQFATIYTAGAQVGNPTLGGTFDTPRLFSDPDGFFPTYPAQYSSNGGNVTIAAGNDILHETMNGDGDLIPDSERELPTSWLYRRGYVDPTTGQYGVGLFGDVASTSWWVDFSNFFEDVGALGGGNVTLRAAHDISNVDAVVPTNARGPKGTPDASQLVQLGGGNLIVEAGDDIDGGAYYVERGRGTLIAGNTIHTNSTRSPSLTIITNEEPYPEQTWLPTTLFLGEGDFQVQARGDILLGPTANPFLLPAGLGNTYWDKSYFSTYASTSAVDVSSLDGSVTFRDSITLPITGVGGSTPVLLAWYQSQFLLTQNADTVAYYQPWLRLSETIVSPFKTETELLAPTLRVTAFSSDINVTGDLNLFPSPIGTLDLAAAGSINGLQVNGVTTINDLPTNAWAATTINLSDAAPSSIPGVTSPFAYQAVVGTNTELEQTTGTDFLTFIDTIFGESGSTEGTFGVLQTKQALHAAGLLHLNDFNPAHLYASSGNISGLTLFSAKETHVAAGNDLTDIAFYIQNDHSTDITIVAAGRDVIAYDPNSLLRSAAQAPGNALDFGEDPEAGDIQINGPGTLELLAGRNLDLGIGNNNPNGTGVGVTSIGNGRNPSLPFVGADIVTGAGIGVASSLENSRVDFGSFITEFLDPVTAPSEAARYLPDLRVALGLPNASDDAVWSAFNDLSAEKQRQVALDIFYLVLRDAGRDHNDPGSSGFNNYNAANEAIDALFPGNDWNGYISLTSREIKTKNGGDISLFAPGGGVTVGFDVGENQPVDQGILTEDGGNISIYARDSVTLGSSRIFTLRGGNEIIYSALGNIAAGVSSKTVLAAPPTRVLIDPQSADVQTDLAGLATGGGIGVLESVAGVPPGDVDLIAPTGVVDAGDAGIRVSGNLNISAVLVLNATNIQVGGSSVGTPVVAAPNVASLTAASNTVGATTNAADQAAEQARQEAGTSDLPSIVTVEVLGYGGSGDDESAPDDQEKRKKKL